MLIPWQKREGFPPALVAANNSAAATIAILIPPSIPLILYSLISGVSIAELFVAGVLPGVALTIAFIAVNNIVSRLRNYPYQRQPFDWPRFRTLALRASPALAMPILILILLRFGIATPTEVSVLAVAYALAAGVLIYRDMTWRRFAHAVIAAGVATGVVMLVIMASVAIGWIMTFVQAPQAFAQWALETLHQPWLIILALIGIMMVAGMFIDLPAAILLLGPIFVPLANEIGFVAAARDRDGADASDRALHPARRHDAVHQQLHCRHVDRQDEPRTLALLHRRTYRRPAVQLRASADSALMASTLQT